MSDKTELTEVPTEQDVRWQAVRARDGRFDDAFFYSVETTGVYCRASCAARRPHARNVRFYATVEAAERAGFRACRRCQPNQPTRAQQNAAKIAQVCRAIEAAQSVPNLDELARQTGWSASHFHRVFKSATGLTPRAYAVATRARRMREGLERDTSTVTEAIYQAGFGSSGRFYAASHEILGMTPTTYRAGGAQTQIYFAVGQCSLGAILVAQSDKGICAIALGDDAELLVRELQDRFARADLVGGDAAFEALVAQVVGWVEAPASGLDLPLDIRGTAFQERVWQALRAIPAGSTATYTQIATQIGAPKSVRAVASACAANTLALAIPCHRVVRNDGALSGYRWGIERKRALLQKEKDAV